MRGIKNFSEQEDWADGGLDVGLTLLLSVTPHGTVRTHREIAEVCGCTHQHIWHIENRAKQKIKAELERRGINPGNVFS